MGDESALGRKVLFICRANICRSPLAEGILGKLTRKGDYQQTWQISSAGTWTEAGQRIHPRAQRILVEKGTDLGEHRSREVTGQLVAGADIILTMETGQAEALRLEFPAAAGKVYPLSVLKGKIRDVADPVGGSDADFRATYEIIEGYLKDSESRLVNLIEEDGPRD